jgi:hypothetical protein
VVLVLVVQEREGHPPTMAWKKRRRRRHRPECQSMNCAPFVTGRGSIRLEWNFSNCNVRQRTYSLGAPFSPLPPMRLPYHHRRPRRRLPRIRIQPHRDMNQNLRHTNPLQHQQLLPLPFQHRLRPILPSALVNSGPFVMVRESIPLGWNDSNSNVLPTKSGPEGHTFLHITVLRRPA